MVEQLRERWTGWGTRLSFAALLLVFSEWVVWQTPTTFSALDWGGIAAVYIALAAISLDLIERFQVNEVFSLLILAGLYGVVNGTLISHVTTNDLPFSLVIRPLAAQPLAWIGALAAFRLLASERASGPVDFGVALIIGLVWGIWVHWFPLKTEESIPTVKIAPALIALAVGLTACGAIRRVLPPADIYRREDWRLTRVEGALMGAILWAALVIGFAQEAISATALLVIAVLGGFMAFMLNLTVRVRRKTSLLEPITPPRRPNMAAWLVLVAAFLLAGWIGYRLPGSGDHSIQGDLLIGALTGYGIVWLPGVSALIGVRVFVQLAREGW
jgi:hypothetical protein